MRKTTEPTAICSSANYRLYGVLSSHVDQVWGEVAPLIEQSVEFSDGKFSTSDIKQFIRDQVCQLWLIYSNSGVVGVLVTQIINYPQDRRLVFLFCAGVDAPYWLYLNEEIKQFARENGCSCVEIYGRPGWIKKLKPFGFKQIHTVLTAPL